MRARSVLIPVFLLLGLAALICFCIFGLSTKASSKIKTDRSISWYLYDSKTGVVSTPTPTPRKVATKAPVSTPTQAPVKTATPVPTASPTPRPVEFESKVEKVDPFFTESDGDFGGVGFGDTPASANQQTEPPRPSY